MSACTGTGGPVSGLRRGVRGRLFGNCRTCGALVTVHKSRKVANRHERE